MFLKAYLGQVRANAKFLKKQPVTLRVPPAYYMYEVFGPNLSSFYRSGIEVAEFVRQQLGINQRPAHLLDLGCGVGRITFPLAQLLDPAVKVYGCDIHAGMINWCSQQATDGNLEFRHQPSLTTLPFTDHHFGSVVVLSIITHTSAADVAPFLAEIHRVTSSRGLVLLTTQGDTFVDRLLDHERKAYMKDGYYYRTIGPRGDRFYSSYHSRACIDQLIEDRFEVVSYKAGTVGAVRPAQDVYVLRRVG
jgi:ubiquinone/menaquinone biosynthesis C-methylase UbiE